MTEKQSRLKEYIGDSVYVEFDGYAFILTTNNGYPDDPRNRIVLEQETYEAFVRFVNRFLPEEKK